MLAGTAARAEGPNARVLGRATSPTGAPLNAASVTLSLGDRTRTGVTGDDGRFVFDGLAPGHYVLHVSALGLRADQPVIVSRGDVLVTAVAGPLGRRPLALALGSSVTAEVVDRTSIEHLPIGGRDFSSIVGLTPATDRTDVAGTERGYQPFFSPNGGDPAQHRFLVDGVDISNLASGGAAPAAPITVDTIESIGVLRGGASSAEYGSFPGSVINITTRSGSNEFHGAGYYTGTGGKLVADPSSPRFGGTTLDNTHDGGVNVGGPLNSGRIPFGRGSFFASLSDQRIDRSVYGAGTPAAGDYSALTGFGKITTRFGTANSLTGSFFRSRYERDGDGASSSTSPASLWKTKGPFDLASLRWNHTLSSTFQWSAAGSWVRSNFTQDPVGTGAPYQDAQGVIQRGNVAYKSTQHATAFDATGTWAASLLGAMHEVTFGGNYRSFYDRSQSSYPGQFVTISTPPIRPTVGITSSAFDFGTTTSRTAFGVSDAITRGRMRIDAGLSYIGQRGRNLSSSALASTIDPVNVPGASYSGDAHRVVLWNSFAPHVSAIYDFDSRVTVRGEYSLSHDPLQIDLPRRMNPFANRSLTPRGTRTFSFLDANGNMLYDVGETTFTGIQYQGGITLSDPKYLDPPSQILSDHAPTSHTFGAGLEWRLTERNIWSASTAWRLDSGILDYKKLVDVAGVKRAALPSDYVLSPATYLTPSGSIAVTDVYFPKSSVTFPGGVLATNGLRTRKSLTSDLQFVHHSQNGGYLGGLLGFKWSRWHVPESPTGDPNVSGFDSEDGVRVAFQSLAANKGGVFIDTPLSYEIYGYTPRPCGLDLSFRASGRRGYPYPEFVTFGTGSSREVVQIGSPRLDPLFMLDGRIAKRFHGEWGTVTPSLEIFNAFNSDTPLQVNGYVNGGNFGRTEETLGGRVVRFGLQYSY
jgi:hypothetical protein